MNRPLVDQPSLASQLEDVTLWFSGKQPESARLFAEANEELRRTGIADRAAGVGQLAPDFRLPNVTGEDVQLSELLHRGLVVLAFYRGGWCPYCNLQLRAYQGILEAIRASGAQLVAVSPQTPDTSLTTSETEELDYPVLSDVGNAVARAYGLVFKLPHHISAIYRSNGIDLLRDNGVDTWELPIPGTFIIRTDGRIALAYVEPDYRKRLEPADLLSALAALGADQ